MRSATDLPGARRTIETRFAVWPAGSSPSALIRVAAPAGCLNLTRIVGVDATAEGAQASARIAATKLGRRTAWNMACGGARSRHRQDGGLGLSLERRRSRRLAVCSRAPARSALPPHLRLGDRSGPAADSRDQLRRIACRLDCLELRRDLGDQEARRGSVRAGARLPR